MRPFSLISTLAVSAIVANACIAESNFADRFTEAGCDREKRCWDDANGTFDMKACKENGKSAAESLLDECTDYDGGLAYKCLRDIKKQACDSYEQTKDCKEFNKNCGCRPSRTRPSRLRTG